MNDDFKSAYLHTFLKNEIRNNPEYHYKLRLLQNCMTYGEPYRGVQVISNGKETRILGPRACKNSWACPHCTATEMKKYATRIAAGIDALYKQDIVPFMMTLTVFHTAQHSCEQVFDLLRQSWITFDKCKMWRRKRKTPLIRKQKNNIEGDTYIKGTVWGNFYQKFKCTHTVRTLEVTHGKHGWHPHIHMLVWVHKDQLQEVAQYEESLNKFWESCVDRTAKKIFTPEMYEVRKFLESKETRPDAEHKSLFISKNADGTIKRWSSGDYLCGWGGENELTGLNMKTARKDNKTPFEILEIACRAKGIDDETYQKHIQLYFDFAWTVLKNRISRVQFSRTGLKGIIDNWLQSEEFKAVIKKKKQQIAADPFHNVAWFTSSQWRTVTYINDYEGIPLIPLIIQFAKYDNGYELICELMQVNNLSIPPSKKHPGIDIAAAFNALIAA